MVRTQLFSIVIVQDALSNRKMLEKLLQRHDVATQIAEDGLIAVNRVSLNPEEFHVIFMDNIMPNMSGIAATKELRKIGFRGLIVGVSGNTQSDDVVAFGEAGADLVLPKPLQMTMLTDLLQRCKLDLSLKLS